MATPCGCHPRWIGVPFSLLSRVGAGRSVMTRPDRRAGIANGHRRGVPLVHGDIGARPVQALRQAEPAKVRTDHSHP